MTKVHARFGKCAIAGGLTGAALLADAALGSAYAQIDEIIVTAQKREQNLQDVPGAVTAISNEALTLSGVQNIEDLQTLTPSLTITSVNTFGNSTQIQMRGVGTSTTNVGLEAAVGFFLDGVYRSRSGTAVGDLIDVERIEVLRGPQGTLFGKNTSAGAISVITQGPTFDYEAKGEVSLGNLNSQRARVYLNAPLVDDRLAVRLSGGYHRRDGYVEDIVNGADYNDLDRWNTRAQILWTPTDDIDVRVIGDWSEASETTVVSVRSVNGPLDTPVFGPLAAAAGGVIISPARPYDMVTSLNDPAQGDFQDRGVSAEINWDLDFATLTSITAYRNYESSAFKDVDAAAVDFFRTDFTFDQEIFTEELRLAGRADNVPLVDSVDWLAGFYYANENIGSIANFPTQSQIPGFLSFFATSQGFPLPPSAFASGEDTGGAQTRGQNGKSYAVFGHATIDINDFVSVIGGARFNREKKIASTIDNTIAGPGNNLLGLFGNFRTITDERYTDEEWTGDVALQLNWTDDIMTYAKFAHGYKAGGNNIDGGGAGTFLMPVDPGFESETSNNYEVGLRSQFWDGRTTLNVTGFHTDFTDFQIQSFDGINFLLSNVSGATSKGVEIETVVSPIDNLTFSGGLTFVEAEFDDGVTSGFAVLGDAQLPLSPKWLGSLMGTYRHPIANADLTFVAHGEISFRSRANLDSTTLSPFAEQNGYSLFNGRMALETDDQDWSVALWCRNCGDKQYASFSFASSFQAGSWQKILGTPRTWGVSLSGRF